MSHVELITTLRKLTMDKVEYPVTLFDKFSMT